MICDICGKPTARKRRITRTFGKGKDLLLIENVPVTSCRSCGETYLSAKTIHSIERIRLLRKQLAAPRAVPVARYVA